MRDLGIRDREVDRVGWRVGGFFFQGKRGWKFLDIKKEDGIQSWFFFLGGGGGLMSWFA